MGGYSGILGGRAAGDAMGGLQGALGGVAGDAIEGLQGGPGGAAGNIMRGWGWSWGGLQWMLWGGCRGSWGVTGGAQGPVWGFSGWGRGGLRATPGLQTTPWRLPGTLQEKVSCGPPITDPLTHAYGCAHTHGCACVCVCPLPPNFHPPSLMAAVAAELDNMEQQNNNGPWENPDPRVWDDTTATAKLFECSRIKALAGKCILTVPAKPQVPGPIPPPPLPPTTMVEPVSSAGR